MVCIGAGVRGLEGLCPLVIQGEFRVVERKVTMRELKRALEERRVREVFGSGTACQVCPVHQILYEGKVRRSCQGRWERKGECPILMPTFPQLLHIPTMENGPELIQRFQKELKAIQVSSAGSKKSDNGSVSLGPEAWEFPSGVIGPFLESLALGPEERPLFFHELLWAVGHRNEPPTTPWGPGLSLPGLEGSLPQASGEFPFCEPRVSR